ncbi:MAG: amidohydrolase/deacetylase family metallohydrolase [Candidatus Latescibacteria bacterium]|jgi:dihydroorotase|nr:amidohydrolase/deacetylase family metallohydrolase [Candidatus Latescibacterota bacterium]
MKRRKFIGSTLAGGALLGDVAGMTVSSPTLAQGLRQEILVQEHGEYDILLQGGHVIDPANNIDRIMDVAVADGKIALVGKNIPVKNSKKTIDVSGLYVSPGFIDIHVHVYYTFLKDGGHMNYIVADDHCFKSGVTTCLDVGSSGSENFEDFKEIIDNSRTRILALINIAKGGMRNSSEQDPRQYDVQLAVDTAKNFPETVVGFKVAHYWTTQPYDNLHTPWANVDAVMEAGRKADLPVMFDWYPRPASGGYPMRSYRELILEKSRPGDIHTHHYAIHIPVIDKDGKVNPDVIKAQERGFIFDCGHGAGSFVWRNAIPAIEQGFISDSISTDLHRGNTNGPVVTMINVMSKYLCMGLPLEDVIRRSTINPAREINHIELGTLSLGATADIAVFEQLKGNFSYLDTSGGKLYGDKRLKNIMTLSGGNIVFDPYALSYPIWENIPKDAKYWLNPSGQYY